MVDPDLVGRNLLKLGYRSYSRNIHYDAFRAAEPQITLSEGLETYLVQKGYNKRKAFQVAAKRTCTNLVNACGAKDSRADALKFRDHLISKGMVGGSVGRILNSIRVFFNFAISEYALNHKNPFVEMYLDKSAGVRKRLPIPLDDIRKVQYQYRLIDDDLRWLVCLISDTGMRLAEGAGLIKKDIILDADIPYIRLKPRSWRTLKTAAVKEIYRL